MSKYDYLIVGSGLFGSIFAHEMNKNEKKCLVIEKRSHVGGNVFTENIENINVHKYGAHIFHTNNKEVWDYIQQFAEFNRYTNSPIAIYKDELYNLPFNMNTFHQMWGIKTPEEAKKIIKAQKEEANIKNPKNLEEQAISLVGKDIYEKLIKGYTEKQWGKKCSELPSFIIKRLPVRFTYDNNYFNDLYQGIPIGGYTKIIEKLLNGIEIKLNTDFFDDKENWKNIADKIVYTGMIDQYYDYCFGELEYRSLEFKHETKNVENYQGNAVVNYNESEIPYTRIIEHKHFENIDSCKTIITKEYPIKWEKGYEAYYPINDEKNLKIFEKYQKLGNKEENMIFGGRLALYKYYDMWEVIEESLKAVKSEMNNFKNNEK
ncbi:UDP-galactopyranose mutase [Methanobrevibacter sp. TMH8]|uniref:UDP-galactopyranose mutase n=1 Tax=Methanobrevibacter sp. TMH8 TaxID=2848611 RepID=UPI001CCCACC3|nr:UDP-galactopyranose mutase [Methanobrevibacter sp. TMH8]MBZ9570436.1 UDP-galactopyranose mutase [Methanobrevibacter sp. TMH8]